MTSEDGTNKIYIINATRLSSSDASLSGIILSHGTLSPAFDANCTSYSTITPYHTTTIEISPNSHDKDVVINIRDHVDGKTVQLNYGETNVFIDVSSPDKTQCKTYHLRIERRKIPWNILTVDEGANLNLKCPICLVLLHCPKSIAETCPKHVFCQKCIVEVTRTKKQNPLNGLELNGGWLGDEPDCEEKLKGVKVCCVYAHYGCKDKLNLIDLGCHMMQCNYRLCLIDKTGELVCFKDKEEKMKVCYDKIEKHFIVTGLSKADLLKM